MTDSNRTTAIVIGKLVIISVIAALLLGITYIPTQEQLEKNIQAAQEEILQELIPDAQEFEPVEGTQAVGEDGQRDILYYRALDESGNVVAYAFFHEQTGYGGPIMVAGAVDSSFSNVLGMDIIRHEETPGLGAKITTNDFRSQFQGVPVSELDLSRDGGSIDAITGATVSSRAVVNAMDSKIEEIEDTEA
ncbi:Rnf electron transport complex subunit RnfG [Methanolobus halotolerans]|uniref:Ion-translocating oxidoreductase complex subunit G n=1 Tax=Methanolobus halotolerans TaxID=2052935 RepID=A0A4E0Q012_9EURY|nr:Rnf electron transport complex subunit RnfG [Methanolobus halotolerans]TGC09662.1 electron transporter RnfG [Methanolobus halotolerans]